jgi:sulfur-oxidizing protein SoxX
MRAFPFPVAAFPIVAVAIGAFAPIWAAGAEEALPGRALAYDVSKGNCLACHAVPGDPGAVTSANIGPPLLQMRQRFPQRDRLLEQLADPMQFNPQTVMPPFGKHGILTRQEIEQIVDFLYTL